LISACVGLSFNLGKEFLPIIFLSKRVLYLELSSTNFEGFVKIVLSAPTLTSIGIGFNFVFLSYIFIQLKIELT
jgi:hypothetical protein